MKKTCLTLLLAFTLLFSSCTVPSLGGDNLGTGDSNIGTDIGGDGNTDGGNTDDKDDNNDKDDTDGNGGSGSGNTDGGNGDNTDNKDDNTDDTDGNGGSGSGNTDNTDGCKADHIDNDDNGVCDECKANVLVSVDFFALNDLHGKFDDTDSQPGVDELTTFIKETKKANPNTVLLSSGDMWQGSSESNLTQGRIVVEWMNALGFSSMTIGNHEYDWGEEAIEQNATLANFPFLAINIYDSGTGKRVEYCEPSVMVETTGGAKIGIIGAIGDCYSSISADKSAGVFFKTGSDLTNLVKAEANRLKDEGADMIVYSVHDGNGSSSSGDVSNSSLSSYYDISLSGSYVDLVFEGHTHQNYVMKDSKGVYHVQNGGDNDGISHVVATVNIASEKTVTDSAKFVPTSSYAYLADDPIVDELLKKYEQEIALANKVVGNNSKYRSSTELRETLATLYYDFGVSVWGEEYDIVLGGGYMSARSPYNLYAGEVRYGDLMAIFPFDNELVLCSVTGANLWKNFFNTSNKNYFIGYGAYGESVRKSLSGGNNLNTVYYIVTDTYSSTYKPNKLTEIYRYGAGVYQRDLLADFIEKGGYA